MSKPSPAPTARDRIVAAAKHHFAKHGFRATTTQEIAKSAGVGTSLLHHHFGTKLELYRVCIADFGKARVQRLQEFTRPVTTKTEFEARLFELVSSFLAEHLRDPDVLQILLRDINESELWAKETEDLLFQFSSDLAVFFEESRKAGLLRSDLDAGTAARFLYLSFSGLLHSETHIQRVSGISLRNPHVQEWIIRSVLDVFFRGIFPAS